MNQKQIDQRERAFARSGMMCAVCGKPLTSIDSQPQYAHRLGNTETNRKLYGSFFIDSTFNGEYVCSLACNQKLDVGKTPRKVLDTLCDILIKEIKTNATE